MFQWFRIYFHEIVYRMQQLGSSVKPVHVCRIGQATWLKDFIPLDIGFLHRYILICTQNIESRKWMVTPPKRFGVTRTMLSGGVGDALALCTSSILSQLCCSDTSGHSAATNS